MQCDTKQCNTTYNKAMHCISFEMSRGRGNHRDAPTNQPNNQRFNQPDNKTNKQTNKQTNIESINGRVHMCVYLFVCVWLSTENIGIEIKAKRTKTTITFHNVVLYYSIDKYDKCHKRGLNKVCSRIFLY